MYVSYVVTSTQQQLQLASHHTVVQTANTASDQSLKCKFLYGKNFDNTCSNLLVKAENCYPSIFSDNSVISAYVDPGFGLCL